MAKILGRFAPPFWACFRGGMATEELADSVGETLGGLLNASFGNAVEMLLSAFALRKGLVSVVQGSLLGSILSNLLLVPQLKSYTIIYYI